MLKNKCNNIDYLYLHPPQHFGRKYQTKGAGGKITLEDDFLNYMQSNSNHDSQ